MMANEDHLPWKTLQARLNHLAEMVERRDAVAVRALLIELVPGYRAGALTDWVASAADGATEGVVALRRSKNTNDLPARAAS